MSHLPNDLKYTIEKPWKACVAGARKPPFAPGKPNPG
jgi:hypothetical protein